MPQHASLSDNFNNLTVSDPAVPLLDQDPPSQPDGSTTTSLLSFADMAAKGHQHFTFTNKISQTPKKIEKNSKNQNNMMPQHIKQKMDELTYMVGSCRLKFKVCATSSKEIDSKSSLHEFGKFWRKNLCFNGECYYLFFQENGFIYLKQVDRVVRQMCEEAYSKLDGEGKKSQKVFSTRYPFKLKSKTISETTAFIFGDENTFKLRYIDVDANSKAVVLNVRFHPLYLDQAEEILVNRFLQKDDQILAGSFPNIEDVPLEKFDSQFYGNEPARLHTWIIVRLSRKATPPTKIPGLRDYQVFIANHLRSG